MGRVAVGFAASAAAPATGAGARRRAARTGSGDSSCNTSCLVMPAMHDHASSFPHASSHARTEHFPHLRTSLQCWAIICTEVMNL
eukprot:8959952-Pyramimonas_sp.AAC.1